MHHLLRHHCWDPTLEERESKKIIASSQEFRERGSPIFVLSKGTCGRKEKVKGEGRNCKMGRESMELDSTYSSHYGDLVDF